MEAMAEGGRTGYQGKRSVMNKIKNKTDEC